MKQKLIKSILQALALASFSQTGQGDWHTR